jgi:hypothetical protein
MKFDIFFVNYNIHELSYETTYATFYRVSHKHFLEIRLMKLLKQQFASREAAEQAYKIEAKIERVLDAEIVEISGNFVLGIIIKRQSEEEKRLYPRFPFDPPEPILLKPQKARGVRGVALNWSIDGIKIFVPKKYLSEAEIGNTFTLAMENSNQVYKAETQWVEEVNKNILALGLRINNSL